MFVFGQEFEIWSFHQSSNLTSVETKRRHEFIEEFWHFATQEKGNMWYQSRKICAVFLKSKPAIFAGRSQAF